MAKMRKKTHKSRPKSAVSDRARIVKTSRKISRKKKSVVIYSATKKRAAKSAKKPAQKRVQKRVALPQASFSWRSQALSIFLSLLATGVIILLTYGAYVTIFKDLPSVDQLGKHQSHLTTKILDRNGKLLYGIYKDENRTLIPLARVPDDVIHATISIEDKSFYSHPGVSVRGIFRALHRDVTGEDLHGGSTITQQLVKNTLLGPERTLRRKIREAILALLVERTYSKDEILEMYLNDVPYGGSTYGIEEAAQTYFGKSAMRLTLAESAFLAGLPAAPSAYTPFGPNPDLANSRQKDVLNRMVEDKYITPEQAAVAGSEVLQFQKSTMSIQAPHFVMYVKKLLEEQYGADVVNQGGLEVRTTLDLDTQMQAQSIVTKEVDALARFRISNGAALMTNPNTGEILVMVGSKDYFDFAHDGQVNVTMRPRQPGSSIKPVTYAVALSKGKKTSSTIVDAPVVFSTPGSPPYAPKNYDGKYHGNVSLRTSLASSYNIPAVKTLAEIGINTMVDQAEAMGIGTWQDRKRFGLSLTLGSGEVLMTDLAEVYGTFATGGETVTLNPILSVKDYKGQTLYRNTCALDNDQCPKTRTLDKKVAYEITDILSDNKARTPAFGPNSVLNIPKQQVAVKTGTTNSLRDNWTIGYTTDRLVAVWVGNNNNQPMSYVASGITGASPIWNSIIRTQLDDAKPNVFPLPGNFVKIAICAQTNTLPCASCPLVTQEVFEVGTQPTQACNPSQFPAKPTATPVVAPKPAATPNPRILNGITTTRKATPVPARRR